MYKKAIDISKYQVGLQIEDVKERLGINDVIIRMGYAFEYDKCFKEFYNKAKELKMNVGCYWCLSGVVDVESQLKIFATYLKNLSFELPIFIDIEPYMKKNVNQWKSILRKFITSLEEDNYFAGIYASQDTYNVCDLGKEFKDTYKWIARYSIQEPTIEEWDMWQYNDDTVYSFYMRNAIDMNFIKNDVSKIIKEKGMNNVELENQNVIFNRQVDLMFELLKQAKQSGYDAELLDKVGLQYK